MNHFFKTLSIILFLLFGYNTNINAQNIIIPTKENNNPSSDAHSATSIRNPAAGDIIVKGVKVDKRAAKYYSKEDLQNMDSNKASHLDAIYISSYEISGNFPCFDKIKNEFDLGPYNHLRKKNARETISVNFNGCVFQIALFSWDEIDQNIKK